MSLLGSAAINQGRHIGLQQLEAMSAATHTFLGPSKRYKMIQDEASGEAVLVCSCYRLLEHLELSGSVAQLLRETARAHWGTLRSGTASLLFLAGVWSRVALECLHQGISIWHIVAGISQEEKWMDETLRILLNLKVDIVLVSGGVTAQLKDHCLHYHILVIEHVQVSILNDFATATGALPVSYITQLTERCVGSRVHVNRLREYRTEGTEWTVVSVATDDTALVTALITSSVHAKLQSMEDQFWSCAYRVHHALKDGKLLPGAGTTELICIHQLQNHGNVSQPEERGDELNAARTASPFEKVILQLMAESWMDYVSTLMVNTGRVMSKTQAWTCIAQHVKQWEYRGPRNNKMTENLLKMKNCLEMMHRVGESDEEEVDEGIVEKERVKIGVYDNMTLCQFVNK
ncbi:hypothetical protein QTP70_011799 [Hemibagrus guttatus]|uniref:Bardet-Biedl syndrome 12 n=1 Tax=Hemibagrus guttatus TaxID=175788 RepID=A0AAE0UZB2_9TELE|nr:hypothetical protein QTP70_011799 [Hemibagrus guttatus]